MNLPPVIGELSCTVVGRITEGKMYKNAVDSKQEKKKTYRSTARAAK
jgi:hypothetical protein